MVGAYATMGLLSCSSDNAAETAGLDDHSQGPSPQARDGAAGGGAPGSWAPGSDAGLPTDLPDEVEVTLDFERPQASERFVYTVNPDSGTVSIVTYMGFLDPWRSTTADPRRMQGVVRHADFSDLAVWDTLHRGEIGDARGSSANGLTSEFLGDYDYVMATNDGAVAVWNDVRDAAVCGPINAYRQALLDGTPTAAPNVQTECPPTFGNSDTFGAAFGDPTP
jgi:hypothetical protein